MVTGDEWRVKAPCHLLCQTTNGCVLFPNLLLCELCHKETAVCHMSCRQAGDEKQQNVKRDPRGARDADHASRLTSGRLRFHLVPGKCQCWPFSTSAECVAHLLQCETKPLSRPAWEMQVLAEIQLSVCQSLRVA